MALDSVGNSGRRQWGVGMRGAGVAAVALVAWAGAAVAGPAVLQGAVTTPLTLDRATLDALPAQTVDVRFETSKGPEAGTYRGVLLWDLLGRAGLVNAPGKNTVLRHSLMVTGTDGYAVAVALGELSPDFAGKAVIVAFEGGAGKASYDHLRLIVPGDRHGGRAVSDLASIEVR